MVRRESVRSSVEVRIVRVVELNRLDVVMGGHAALDAFDRIDDVFRWLKNLISSY